MISCLLLGRLGRFGNSLYQIASIIGIARLSNQSYAFPRFISHDNGRFNPNEPIDLYNHLAHELPELPGNASIHFQEVGYFWGYRDIVLAKGNWTINAHLQSPKYFNHAIEEVRHFLTFKNEYQDNDYCAIHYRAGDYMEGKENYHPRMTREYYEKAISCMPAGTKFMVFTDDKQEAIKLFNGIPFIYFHDAVDYIDDFKMMKACKHFIISNSTYSSMAATLANQAGKIVISPSGDNWFGEAAGGMTCWDIMQDDWIKIKIW